MTRRVNRILSAAALTLWASSAAAQPALSDASLTATIETEPSAASAADSPAIWTDPADPAKTLILGSDESGGIHVYDARGRQLGGVSGDARSIDLRSGAAPGGRALVASLDGKSNAPKLLALDGAGRLEPLVFEAPAPALTAVGLCLARSHRDGSLYLFVLGEEGGIEQWLVAPRANGGDYVARLARRWAMGSEVGYCAADDRGSVYVSQESVGVWRFGVEPEAEIVPEIVDIVRFGHISGKAKGVAVAPDGRLLIADAAANRINLYQPAQDYAYLGSVTMPGGALDAVTDPGGVAAKGGLVVVADDDNAPQANNFKILSWIEMLAALKLPERTAPPPPPPIAVVRPTVETRPVETGGDAADDPAVWIDPADPARSVVIGTQKQSGLYVYDLSGEVLQFLPDGRMNNVDLRSGFELAGRETILVAASNRTTKGISLYTLDPATRRLTDVADGLQRTGFADPYGLCMYKSSRSGKTYVFVNQTDGKMRQWELGPTKAGKVRAKLMRDLPFASQVEGCAADDETGMLYVGEEDVGLWRQGAEPKGGRAREMFAAIKDNPALKEDMEGIGIFAKPGGKGYLVVSSQGNDSYAVFHREGDNAYVGSFAIGADGSRGIDGVSETDGLDVTSLSAGPDYPDGLLVTQDGRNVSPPDHQNFKLVSWRAVEQALKLGH